MTKVIQFEPYRRDAWRRKRKATLIEAYAEGHLHLSELTKELDTVNRGGTDAKQNKRVLTPPTSVTNVENQHLTNNNTAALLGIVPTFDCPQKFITNYWEILSTDLSLRTMTIRCTDIKCLEGWTEEDGGF